MTKLHPYFEFAQNTRYLCDRDGVLVGIELKDPKKPFHIDKGYCDRGDHLEAMRLQPVEELYFPQSGNDLPLARTFILQSSPRLCYYRLLSDWNRLICWWKHEIEGRVILSIVYLLAIWGVTQWPRRGERTHWGMVARWRSELP